MKKDAKAKRKQVPQSFSMETLRTWPIITDPQGCYTGKPLENYAYPVQDADDL